MMKNVIRWFVLVGFWCVLVGGVAMARENVTDWYIKDFKTKIVVNKDSSLLITEKIVADCGQAQGKHGIFRVLPTSIKTSSKTIKMPVKLISITDFSDNPLPYSEYRDVFDPTITWKIGDPDVTVKGENFYKITYLVKNAVRGGNAAVSDIGDFDELYWNLNGNFWDLEIDNFQANIVFPVEINKNNTRISYYTGEWGGTSQDLAAYKWVAKNVLQFNTTQTLACRQGITASIIFPKGMVTLYQAGFFEEYGSYFWFILPLVVLVFCYLIWSKYGRDPNLGRPTMPEFEVPENLTPIDMGMVMDNGHLRNENISATIVSFAVQGFISIQEIPPQIFLGSTDYKLKKIKELDESWPPAEKFLFKKLFENEDDVLLSSLKKKFYVHVSEISKLARERLLSRGYMTKAGLNWQIAFAVMVFFSMFGCVLVFIIASFWAWLPTLLISLIVCFIIFIVFAVLMPQRTLKGAELAWRIRGFKLYMETAEKHRQQFYEKENIFEKFLPYAIGFSMAGKWAAKMRQIYGEEKMRTYHPVWYAGSMATGFKFDSFASNLDRMSRSIGTSVGGTSGSGGGGFSGGGGGGGGGGGW